MRFSAIFPVLCAIAALVLSFLCLFAGSSRSFLQSGEIVTLNASMFGHNKVFNTSDGNGGVLSNIANSIEGDINGIVNNATADVAHALGIHDFYKVFIMTYCEGYYEPGPIRTNGSKIKDNVTYCSKRTALFHFNPTAILQDELKPGITLDDLDWPNDIKTAVNALHIAMTAMFVCYCIGIGFAVFALIGALLGFFANGRISSFLNFVLFFIAFVALGIASAIATALADKIAHAVNKYGKEVGLSATKGTEFLAMTWVATALMLLGSLVWIAECCIGRRRRSATYTEKGY